MVGTIRVAIVAALVACGSDTITDPTGAGASGGSAGTGGGGTGGGAGFTIAGNAVVISDFVTPAPAGLCVAILDPTPALAGGEPAVLGSTTLDAAGAFSVSGIVGTSSVGLLISVSDCPGGTPSGALATATGIEAADYANAADGAVLDGYVALLVDAPTAGAWSAGLAAAGYTGDLAAEGSLLGMVLDPMGAPVDGGVVTGPPGTTVYYFEGNGFGSGSTGTVAAAGGLFLIPAAPIFTYGCTGGGYTYTSILAGSQPGFQVIVAFNGT